MKVILHKLFPYAPYLNEYIGFEMDVADDCDPLVEVETLRRLAEESHRGRYPHLYPNGSEATVEGFATPFGNNGTTQSSQKENFLKYKIMTEGVILLIGGTIIGGLVGVKIGLLINSEKIDNAIKEANEQIERSKMAMEEFNQLQKEIQCLSQSK